MSGCCYRRIVGGRQYIHHVSAVATAYRTSRRHPLFHINVTHEPRPPVSYRGRRFDGAPRLQGCFLWDAPPRYKRREAHLFFLLTRSGYPWITRSIVFVFHPSLAPCSPQGRSRALGPAVETIHLTNPVNLAAICHRAYSHFFTPFSSTRYIFQLRMYFVRS